MRSSPAMEAVCVADTLAPISVTAALRTTIGFSLTMRRARLRNLCPSLTLSRYMAITLVAGSSPIVFQHVAFVDVAFVAQAGDLADAEVFVDQGQEDAGEKPRLADEAHRALPDVPLRQEDVVKASEAGVEAGVGIEGADAVRPHDPCPGGFGQPGDLVLEPRPGLVHLAEAGALDDDRFDSAVRRIRPGTPGPGKAAG